MRAIFVGASTTTVATARMLLKRNHEVVIIEQDKDRIDALAEELDCGFIHGDGGKPAILREVNPERADVLYCLTDNDQANILASLVGRSLGFKRVVTKIQDPEFVHVCIELGLRDTIIPSLTIARHLGEMFEGHDPLEISAKIRGDARIFSFVVHDKDPRRLSELELPKKSRVVCLYRGDEWLLPDEDTRLAPDDEVVIITAAPNLERLTERWSN
jgi:trk system potassium uptake protein TrkA